MATAATATARLAWLAFVATMAVDWPAPPLPAHAAWADAAMALAGLAFALAWIRGEVRLATGGGALSAALGYVTWAGVSAAWAGHGAWKWLGLVELSGVFALACGFGSDEEFRDKILRAWIGGAAVLCVAGLVGSGLTALGYVTPLTSTGGAFGWSVRPKGLCTGTDMLATACLAPALFVLGDGAGDDARRWVGRARPWLLALFGLTIALTLSRTALALAWGVVLLRVRRRGAAVVSAVIAALGLAALVAVVFRYDPVLPDVGLQWSAAPGLRLRIAESALDTFAHHPLFGVGPASHAAWLGDWPRAGAPPRPWDAHLTPLDLLAVLGAPGLALFALFVGLALRAGWRQRPSDPVRRLVLVAAAATLFDGLSLDLEDFRHVWLLLGLVAAGAPRRGADAEVPLSASRRG